MTDSELHKLKRSELLEMMVEQSKEIDRLKRQLAIAAKRLRSRELMLQEAGSIAEAAVSISNVFADAQKAAELYLENVERICRKQASEADVEEKWDEFLENDWDHILQSFESLWQDEKTAGDSDG